MTPLRVTAVEVAVEAKAQPTLRLVMTAVEGRPEATATPRPRVVLAGAAAPEAALEAPAEAAPVAAETAVAEEEATPAATEEAVEEAEAAPTAEEEAPAAEEATETAPLTETAPITEVMPVTETTPVTEAVPMSPTAASPAETGEGALLDVVDTAAALGNLTTLVAAIEAAGLGDILRGEGPYTIFAPTDEAFAALPTGRLDELMADPSGDLLDILLYHVLPGRVMVEDVSDGQQLETIQGAAVTFTVGKGGVLINATNIITPDIEATNGVLHVIGHVLSAPVGEGEEVPPGEEVSAGETITGSAEVTGSAELTPSGAATLTVPIIVSNGATSTGAITGTEGITDTGPLTGSVPITDGETVSDTAAGNAAETAAAQAAVVVSPPARRPSAPIAAPAEVWRAPEGPLEVLAPVSGGAYHSPIDVTGLARTFTGNVAISLVGEDGALLAERATVGGTGDAHAFFATYLRFTVSEPAKATLYVTDMDMAEGTVMAQVSVPVTLLPGQRVVDVTYPAVG
ncbi:MAG: hypothetical protein DCC57_04310, partial [Chloroflexi bacterium]